MAVFAVIPTYNRQEVLLECLAALSRQSVPVDAFVGDSASPDGAAEAVAARFPKATVCRGHADLWWTGATNLALRAALARCGEDDFILCINDDVTMDAGYVARLVAAARKEPRRLVGSLAVAHTAPDIIIDGGSRFNWYTAAFRRLNNGRRIDEFPAGHEEEVNVLPGRGTLVPVAAFREVGLFAERELPHYAADYEFSVRCAKAGFRLVVAYDAVLRSRTDLSGVHAPENGLSLGQIRRLLFDRRSSTNVRDRFHFAWATRHNPLQAALFFAFSMGRILGHHILHAARRA